MKDKIGWGMLLDLIMEDILSNHMAEIKELDEIFKGIAVNGQGIGIDFEEIRKAEEMYD